VPSLDLVLKDMKRDLASLFRNRGSVEVPSTDDKFIQNVSPLLREQSVRKIKQYIKAIRILEENGKIQPPLECFSPPKSTWRSRLRTLCDKIFRK